jgi:hypothetical protein
MAELHLYDFDGTLFRSPKPPMWWGYAGKWWSDPQSLSPPCVPAKPGAEWWIGNVVSQARRSIANPDVWAIACTGRQDGPFRWRVPELLHQKGLRFDEVFLNTGGSTSTFKQNVIRKLLRRYPDIDTVQVWEDRGNHLRTYMSLAESLGRRGIPHFIQGKGSQGDLKDPLCLENPYTPDPSRKVSYAGVVLDSESNSELLKWWAKRQGPLLSSKFAHHFTVAVKPSYGDLAKLPIGETFSLRVIGVAYDEKGQAVVVAPDGIAGSDDRIPHITVSMEAGLRPDYSNTLLAKGWGRLKGRGPVLTGRLGFFDGKSVHFQQPPSVSKVAEQYLDSQGVSRTADEWASIFAARLKDALIEAG